MSIKYKFSFKNNQAIKADTDGIKKKKEVVLLAEFSLIKTLEL